MPPFGKVSECCTPSIFNTNTCGLYDVRSGKYLFQILILLEKERMPGRQLLIPINAASCSQLFTHSTSQPLSFSFGSKDSYTQVLRFIPIIPSNIWCTRRKEPILTTVSVSSYLILALRELVQPTLRLVPRKRLWSRITTCSYSTFC